MVDLPDPDRPIRAIISPCSTARETSRNARTSTLPIRYVLSTFSSLIIDIALPSLVPAAPTLATTLTGAARPELAAPTRNTSGQASKTTATERLEVKASH